MKLEVPRHTKTARSLIGLSTSINQIYPESCLFTRPSLAPTKKESLTNNKIQWIDSHTKALKEIKTPISKTTEKNTSTNKRNIRLKKMQATKAYGQS